MPQVQAPAPEQDQPLLLSPAWSLRGELSLLFVLLALALLTVAANGFLGLYQYQQMAEDLRRVEELPAAAELNSAVGDLRIAVAEHLQRQRWSALQAPGEPSPGLHAARTNVGKRIDTVREKLAEYLQVLQRAAGADGPLAQTYKENAVAEQMTALLDALQREYRHPVQDAADALRLCDRLQHLAGRLPALLQRRLNDVPDQVRNRYRLQIQMTWLAAAAGVALLGGFLWRFSRRVLVPLRDLVAGARLIAQGRLDYRFRLPGRDEMAQLAQLLNQMIEKFLHIRHRLDERVQQVAEQKMRNQRLAVVGLLASGVGQQIEPALRRIAQAAEHLHRWSHAAPLPVVEPEVLERLQHIQSGAFACKQITQRLLQLARQNQQGPQQVELNQLVGQALETWRGWEGSGLPELEVRWRPGPRVQVLLSVQEFHVALLALLRGLSELALPGSLELGLHPLPSGAKLRIEFRLKRPAPGAEEAFRHLGSGSYGEEPSWLSLAAAMFAEAGIRLRYQLSAERAQVELEILSERTACLAGDAA